VKLEALIRRAGSIVRKRVETQTRLNFLKSIVDSTVGLAYFAYFKTT
jgi:hypothetical protein